MIVSMRTLLWLFSLPLLLAIIMAEAGPQALGDDRQELLRKSTDSVWYSVDEDKIASSSPRSRNQVNTDDRHDELASPKQQGVSPVNATWLGGVFKAFVDFVSYAWLTIVIMTIAAGITILVVFVLRVQRLHDNVSTATRSHVSLAQQQKKVTDLPFELQQSNVGLLDMAARFREQGDYSKAIIYLFSHILIELDAVGHIRLERGKTNWTYLRELRSQLEERSYTSHVVQWFEHVFFGKHQMDARAFESIWAGLKGFEAKLGLGDGKRS